MVFGRFAATPALLLGGISLSWAHLPSPAHAAATDACTEIANVLDRAFPEDSAMDLSIDHRPFPDLAAPATANGPPPLSPSSKMWSDWKGERPSEEMISAWLQKPYVVDSDCVPKYVEDRRNRSPRPTGIYGSVREGPVFDKSHDYAMLIAAIGPGISFLLLHKTNNAWKIVGEKLILLA